MGLVVKALVVALLTLPVMAYVTGSMVGARSDLPAQRAPVVIGDPMDVEPQQTIETEPARPRPDDRDDDPDDAEDRDGPDDGDPDDDSVSVVRPQPRDIDDDADDRDDGPDDDSRDHSDDSGDDGD